MLNAQTQTEMGKRFEIANLASNTCPIRCNGIIQWLMTWLLSERFKRLLILI